MTNAEKKELYSVGLGMSEEEKRFILKAFPSNLLKEELKRREDIMSQSINDMKEIMFNTKSNMSLEEMANTLNNMQNVIRKN